ncbi:MAG: V-type ATP synthase subunit D [Oscillospiraceae bacterium]|nr:V-type ATP synthase subunit D [Oscillospiraceae bacterium]
MNAQTVPTKGNLIAIKKSLGLAKTGFDLLDKKRNILVRELMTLIDHANEIQDIIDSSYSKAYLALQNANITLGICEELACTVPIDDTLKLSYRSVMGVEIPIVSIEETSTDQVPFGLLSSSSALDEAYLLFLKVKQLTAKLAEIENSIYRLAKSIKKTQKRANALKNIIIPKFHKTLKFISDTLEEKDREDFSRLKVIKEQHFL